MNLYNETLELLNSTQKTRQEISDGSNVSYRWLFNLANKKSKDLSVSKVQRVHDYLKGKHIN